MLKGVKAKYGFLWSTLALPPPYGDGAAHDGLSLPGFVTNLAELTPSQVVRIYQKRWAIALVHWELQSGLGLGEHQVRGDTNRSEQSVGIAVLACLFVLRACHHEIIPGKPWSIV